MGNPNRIEKFSFDKKVVDIGTMNYGIIKDCTVFLGNTNIVKMAKITPEDLYEDAILIQVKGSHLHQEKWVTELNIVILWNSLHNFLVSNETRAAIRKQIHLNSYTKNSCNKWHKASNLCALCEKGSSILSCIVILSTLFRTPSKKFSSGHTIFSSR